MSETQHQARSRDRCSPTSLRTFSDNPVTMYSCLAARRRPYVRQVHGVLLTLTQYLTSHGSVGGPTVFFLLGLHRRRRRHMAILQYVVCSLLFLLLHDSGGSPPSYRVSPRIRHLRLGLPRTDAIYLLHRYLLVCTYYVVWVRPVLPRSLIRALRRRLLSQNATSSTFQLMSG